MNKEGGGCIEMFVKTKLRSNKGGVRVTQNIVKKGPTLITFDIKH